MLNWYALQVRSACERIVETALLDRSIETFFPFSSYVGYRRRTVIRPFFPGYVFSRLDPADRRPLHRVPQVVRIVGVGEEPVAIPDAQIASVRRVAEVAAELAAIVEFEPAKAFAEGQRVVVRRGPLAGVEGYVAFLKNATRIVVWVQMLGQGVSAEVDAETLAPVPDRLAV